MPDVESTEALQQLVARLEAELADLQRRLPAHSIPPPMLARLDELDEQLAVARARLKASENNPPPG